MDIVENLDAWGEAYESGWLADLEANGTPNYKIYQRAKNSAAPAGPGIDLTQSRLLFISSAGGYLRDSQEAYDAENVLGDYTIRRFAVNTPFDQIAYAHTHYDHTAVNADPQVGDKLKVVFLPNYRVSAMEIICPGTDLSEQISTAGKEASGTGNMKFMMNGAITIGTLDGANIEIREEVGDENFFLFGLTAAEVEAVRENYNPNAIIAADEDLGRVMRLLESGHFNQFEPGLFDPVIQSLRSPFDPWVVAADFRSYVDAQRRAANLYRDQERWTRMSILNTAASGKFSTDRTMREYNAEIWKLTPIEPRGE